MTRSELMAVMTGGMATVAGGVLAAYVGMGISAGHLIAASVMSAPAALVMAKIMIPETEESTTAGHVTLDVDVPYVNVIDAAAQGAGRRAQAGAQTSAPCCSPFSASSLCSTAPSSAPSVASSTSSSA